MYRISSVIFAACLLAACSTQTKPIVISRTKIVQSAQLALTAVEAGVASYNLQHPIAPDVMSKLSMADAQAHELIAEMQVVPSTQLPARAQMLADAIQAVVVTLPPGVLPPAAEAGLIAFGTLAEVVAQTAPQPDPSVVMSSDVVPAPTSVTPAVVTTPVQAGSSPPVSQISK